jgi:hypothetical protein
LGSSAAVVSALLVAEGSSASRPLIGF